MKLKEFIDRHTKHLSQSMIDKRAKEFRHRLFNKDRVVVDWLSSPLQGVHVITWTDKDKSNLFDTFGVDIRSFEMDIPHIDGINMDFKVSSNPIYILCTILMHRIIGYKKDDEVIENLFLIEAFRIVTSAYSNYYKYPVDEYTARRVYDRLSKKHLIKQLGNNYKVLVYKSQYLKRGTDNYKKLKKLDIDNLILIINSVSGSVRQYIHSAFLVLLDIVENDESGEISIYDNEGKMLEIQNNTKMYYEYIEKILINRHMLIDKEVINLVGEVLKIDVTGVDKVLLALHDEFRENPDEILKLVDEIVNATLYYLYKNEFYPPYDQSIPTLIAYLKAYWSNSRVKNEDMKMAKQRVTNVIIKRLKIVRLQTLMKFSILVCIYLFLMATLMHKR